LYILPSNSRRNSVSSWYSSCAGVSVKNNLGLSCASDAVLPGGLHHPLSRNLDVGRLDVVGYRISA
jgi:hypothetical protein